MINRQLYVKKENCPFDLEYFPEVSIYKFNNINYVKIDVCSYVGDFSEMCIVDVELTEQIKNKDAGKFNGFGTVPDKDFSPVLTSYLEEF